MDSETHITDVGRSLLVCTKILKFCASHRLIGHEGLCANLHGHNYRVGVSIKLDQTQHTLDSVGRILDFSEIKSIVGGWIDTNWDHAMIVDGMNDELVELYEEKGFRYYDISCNPTAENMALYLLNTVGPSLFEDSNLSVYSVRVYETETSFAHVSIIDD